MWENTATLKRNLARCAKRRNYVIGSHRNDYITSIQWKNPLFFIVKDQCHPNPCLHDGMCMEVNDELGFLCNCTAGYRGSHCQGTLRDNGIYHTFIYCAFFWWRPRGTWLKLERNVVKGLIKPRVYYDKKKFIDVFGVLYYNVRAWNVPVDKTIYNRRQTFWDIVVRWGNFKEQNKPIPPPPRPLPVPLHPKLMCLLFSTGSSSIALRGWGRESFIFLCLS